MDKKLKPMIVIQSDNKKEFAKKFNSNLPTEKDKHISELARRLFDRE